MECPSCGHENLPGAAQCDSCFADLTAHDRDVQTKGKGRLQGAVLGKLGEVEMLDPLHVQSGDNVQKAVDLMRSSRSGSVVVMEDGTLVGTFTERDLMTRVDLAASLDEVSMRDVMSPNPRTYHRKNSLAHAINATAIKGNRHLPLLDDDQQIVGLISVRGIIAHIRKKAGL